MPRTLQKKDPSKEKHAQNAKLAKSIKKKNKNASGSEKQLTLEEKRLKRKQNLLNRFKEMANKFKISKVAPTVRCINKAVQSVHDDTDKEQFGKKIRVSAQAVKNINSYADSVIHNILIYSKEFIPKNQKTLKKHYIEKVLSSHKFREFLRPVDGHV